MTMSAKYAGKCRKCGGAINPGDQIDWERGRGAAHINCPESNPQADPGQSQSDLIRISQGEGYGGSRYEIGSVLRKGEQILIVQKSAAKYYSEDGMSFGVGDESGHVYFAWCRVATAEESAPMLAREQAAAEKKAAKTRLAEISDQIRQVENYQTEEQPEGDRLLDTQNIYGGGDWFVIGPEWIWYCCNNGADGDDWSRNNVHTGGAGAIGWRVAHTAELANDIRELAAKLS